MKKILPILLFMITSGLVMAQASFSDDFEGYQEGDFIGAQNGWTTWSGTPGGGDDATISTEEAYSGSNSLKFESYVSTGGPADVVLPFPYRITAGSLVFTTQMYVVEGTGAYFNFQGGSQVGQVWAAEAFFDDDGTCRVVSGSTERLKGSFPHDEWFEVQFRIDVTNNAWEAIINGECLGVFTNDANLNAVGSIDFYPVNSNGISIYFIDDVTYEVELDGFDPIQLDAGLNSITIKEKSLTGLEVPIGGTIRNNGENDITSIELQFDGGGLSFTETIDNISVGSGETYDFVTQENFTFVEGETDIQMSIIGINGAADEKDCNDAKSAKVEGITPAQDRRVLIEEATGTWCGWCPRGEVALRYIQEDFGDYVVPIAVHGSPAPGAGTEPMENEHIVFATGSFPGFGGFPNIMVEREGWFSFGSSADLEPHFFDNIGVDPIAKMELGADWDDASRTLKVSLANVFNQDVNGGYALDVLLVEDDVTGTTAAYNQVNYYSGGAQGPLDGYENLPNPIPAADMVYDHVSRGSMTTFQFHDLPSTAFTSGDKYVANFEMVLPAEYDETQLHLVGTISNSDGTINNVFDVTLQEAIDHGYEAATSNEDLEASTNLNVYPNPAMNRTFVQLELIETSHVQISVVNALGAVVASRDYGKMSGEYTFPVDLSNLEAGIYQVHIQVDEEYTTRSVNVIK